MKEHFLKKATLFSVPIYLMIGVALFLVVKNNVTIKANHRKAVESVLTSAPIEATEPVIIQDYPEKVIAKDLVINLPIVTQSFNNSANTWLVDEYRANYMAETVQLNDTKGKTVIYGHNAPQVFGSLSSLKRGDTVFVTGKNGTVFHYEYIGYRSVTPEQTEVLNGIENAEPGLLLVTCGGTWNQNRVFYEFSLTEVRQKA